MKQQHTDSKTAKELGAASIFIELDHARITVKHGTDNVILFEKDAVEGDWDKIWTAIRATPPPATDKEVLQDKNFKVGDVVKRSDGLIGEITGIHNGKYPFVVQVKKEGTYYSSDWSAEDLELFPTNKEVLQDKKRWFIEPFTRAIAILDQATMDIVAELPKGNILTREDQKANAQLIVTAVNNHAALVEIIRRIESFYALENGVFSYRGDGDQLVIDIQTILNNIK